MADYALQTDGSQNYISLGTMGNFGSNLGSGLYIKFYINGATHTNGTIIGTGNSGNQYFKVNANDGAWDRLQVYLRDNNGLLLKGYADNISTFDGITKTIEITITPSTNTIVIKVNGVSQTVTYVNQQTPATFVNFPKLVSIGARSNGFATMVEFLAITIDGVEIGTSSSTLYGSYAMDEGSGTTTADSSGNNNTGTLTGSPVPSWVTGLGDVISSTAVKSQGFGHGGWSWPI